MGAEVSGIAGTEERESQVRTVLADMLASRHFRSSPLLGHLLTFLVEEELAGRAVNLKETYVGHLVYGRPATYDPKLDSVVRVNANRLRSRLMEYHADHSTASPRIMLRPGSYIPVYEFGATPTSFDLTAQQTNQSQAGKLPLMEVEFDSYPEETAGNSPLVSTRVAGHAEADAETYWSRTTPFLSHGPAPAGSTTGLERPGRPASRTVPRWAVLAFCVILGGILVTVAARFSKKERPAQWTAEPLSNLGGVEAFADISPDGRQLAFSWKAPDAAHPYIYFQTLTGQAPKRLTSSSNNDESRPVWSPDSTSIAFLRVLALGDTEVIVKSIVDGSEEKVAALRGSYPWLCTIPRLSWTPDGKKLLTSERIGEACGVIAINVATRSLQPITQSPPGSIGDLEAAVSPNGKQVAFLRSAGTLSGDIYVTSIEGGPVRRVTFDNRDIMGFCWISNGSGFIVSSRRGDGVPRLWQVSLDGTSVKPMTDGLTLAAFPSMSQGDRIVFTTYHTTTSIRQVSNGSEKVLISDQSGNSAPQLSPDGKSLVYRSDRTGSFELWVSRLGEQSGFRLTDFKGPMANNPRWSPDGKKIVFECRPNGQSDICMVSLDRPMEIHVLNRWMSNEIFPSWSHDGRSVYFTSNYSGRWEIYRQPAEGGDPVAITHDGGMRALQSGDGHWLYVFRDEEPRKVFRIPTADRPDRQWEANKPEVIWNNFASDLIGRWDTAPDGITYLAPAVSSSDLREKVISIKGDGPVHEIDTVKGPSPSGDLIFSTAPDGKSFVYVKEGLQEGDIGLLLLQPARH